MISKNLFNKISKKYGHVASWAVWAKPGNKPKSNIEDMRVLDPVLNPSLLETINTDVVMVALNFSREVGYKIPFMNFHSNYSYAQDYKIRYAFEGTSFYGAYMTDIIKDFPKLLSKEVLIFLRDNPNEIRTQMNRFREEMTFIKSERPSILAFGKQTYDILYRGLNQEDYASLVQLTHYSHQISKENYRKDVFKKLGIPQENNS
ncbi:MAG: hypothetical protein JW927_17930 [Deltaproteobacteria bacterium]|nr:hypothetical protein [Deltaproteobacteria bacterium]